uniref:(northern house mosquito) hypothetical protein n=1 Tax=Culex pipiens TaxID=7175 RepID=A0A8D8A773_CULPI
MRLSERTTRVFDAVSTREPAPAKRHGHLRRTPTGRASGSLLPGVALRAAHHRCERDLLQLVHDGVVALFPELWHRCLDQEHHHDPGLPAVEHDPAVREPQVQPTAGPEQFCPRRWRLWGRRSDGAGAAATGGQATTVRLSTGRGQQLAAG